MAWLLVARKSKKFPCSSLYLKYGTHEIDLTREKDYNQFFCNHEDNSDESDSDEIKYRTAHIHDNTKINHTMKRKLTNLQKFTKKSLKLLENKEDVESVSRCQINDAQEIGDIKKYKCILPWFSIPITVVPQCHRYNFLRFGVFGS